MTTITKGFCKKNPQDETQSDCGRYNIEIFDSILDIEEEWSLVSSAHDVFFGIDFLRCIEKCPASGIKPYYSIVREGSMPVGIIYFQSKYVKLKENLRDTSSIPKTIIQKLSGPLRHAVVNSINVNTVICGNLLLTGGYGFYFKDHVKRGDQFNIVLKAIDKLQKYLKNTGTNPALILIKDFFTEDTPPEGDDPIGYTKFTVQPKMILDIRPEWKTFDDYMESLKSKYRVRARKALDKAKDIVKIVYNVEEIAQHRDTIHSLYKNVSDQADFNAFILHPEYFENLQAAFGTNMKFTTYWKEGKMIAFFTSIKNYDILDAHFLGYDHQQNIECQIYLNMLYDLIKDGIAQNVKQVDMSRTAVEIKSTVGAVPHQMYLFLKHSNSLINKTVERILSFVKPDADFIIRSPFRDETEVI